MKSRCASSLAANKRGIQCLAVSDLEASHPIVVMPFSLHLPIPPCSFLPPARCLSVSLSLALSGSLALALAGCSSHPPFRVFGACGKTQVGSPPPPPPPPPPPSELPATGRTRLYKAALLLHSVPGRGLLPCLNYLTARPLFLSLTGVASRQQILLRRSLCLLLLLLLLLPLKS